MSFSFDGDPRVRTVRCDACDGSHDAVTGFVLRDGRAHAVHSAWADPHAK